MARKKSQKIESVSPSDLGKTEEKAFILNKLNWAWVGLAVVMLITVVVRWKFINVPFERDEGTYAYFGQLVLDGKIPYVDFYEMKLPGIYYTYALLLAVFGETLEGIHIAFVALNLACIDCRYFHWNPHCSLAIALFPLTWVPGNGVASIGSHNVIKSAMGKLLVDGVCPSNVDVTCSLYGKRIL